MKVLCEKRLAQKRRVIPLCFTPATTWMNDSFLLAFAPFLQGVNFTESPRSQQPSLDITGNPFLGVGQGEPTTPVLRRLFP